MGNWEHTDKWEESGDVCPSALRCHCSCLRTSPSWLMYRVVLLAMKFCFANLLLMVINGQHPFVLLNVFSATSNHVVSSLSWPKMTSTKLPSGKCTKSRPSTPRALVPGVRLPRTRRSRVGVYLNGPKCWTPRLGTQLCLELTAASGTRWVSPPKVSECIVSCVLTTCWQRWVPQGCLLMKSCLFLFFKINMSHTHSLRGKF